MENHEHTRRDHQADVYFALATIIQSLTLTAVGNEMVVVLRTIPFPELLWSMATGLLSLILCFTLWYIFSRDFFFGFRVIQLTAQDHFVMAAAIFTSGFLQFIAFQFLADPRLWLTLVLMSTAVVFFNSWYFSNNIKIIDREDVHRAMHYLPRQAWFTVLIIVALVCLAVWYTFPAVDTPLFRGFALLVMAAALVTLNIQAVKVFQKHLDVDLTSTP